MLCGPGAGTVFLRCGELSSPLVAVYATAFWLLAPRTAGAGLYFREQHRRWEGAAARRPASGR